MSKKNKPINSIHEFFMNKAFIQAQKAYYYHEVPIGAVIVNPEGKIIARAYNQIEKKQTQTAHAELLALAKAGKKFGWRLENCWIYVTLEPCSMCMHAIALSRMAGIVYGASSPVFGFSLDKNVNSGLDHWSMKIIKNIGKDQAAELLIKFFKEKRGTTHDRKSQFKKKR